MLFLIDYENVGNAGMKGYEHLDARDHVIIFYSDAMRNIERRVVDTISSCGCVFQARKECPGFLYRIQAWRIDWQRVRRHSGDYQSRWGISSSPGLLGKEGQAQEAHVPCPQHRGWHCNWR